MKRLIIFALLVLSCLSTIVAQPSGREILAHQAEQYVQDFHLNDSLAAQFKTTYYAYAKDMRAVRKEYAHATTADQVLTEEEIEQRMLDNFSMSRAILNLREQYYHRFRRVLSPSQIKAIFDSEKARRAQQKK